MSGSDHLIERAAALLLSGQAAPGRTMPDVVARHNGPSDEAAEPASQGLLGSHLSTGPSASPASIAVVTPGVPGSTRVEAGRNRVPLPAMMTPSSAKADASPSPTISLEALERAGLVVARTARTRISEEYRIVIGRILRALREEQDGGGAHNVVMITSARPGEGKSFSALNLAGSIAQHGTEKVLLIDLDAKLKPISTQLGVGDRIGLQDLVVNSSLRPEDVILHTSINNLLFMPVGTRVGEAMDPTSVRPIPPAITRIARRFPKHLIVLDAPPCLSTSDPHTVAPYVGQVVMVVEAERTQRTEVEAAIDLVRVCPTITILLNKVRLTTSHTFGAYDYYGSYT